MSTTTESRTEAITAQFKRALRHADSIVFRLYQGQATIEANRDAHRSPTGFNDKQVLHCGGPNVHDFEREHSWVPESEWHRYTGFHMEFSGIRGDQACRTLVDRLRVGGHAELHWLRGNSSEVAPASSDSSGTTSTFTSTSRHATGRRASPTCTWSRSTRARTTAPAW